MAGNKSCCDIYARELDQMWLDTADKRAKLLALSKQDVVTDEECDALIKWACGVTQALEDFDEPTVPDSNGDEDDTND